MRIFNLLLLAGAIAAAASAAPSITGVFNAANDQPTIASATFISIFGSNLATTTDSWSNFAGGNLPGSLDGVQVTINGIPAYVAFVSPGQINVIVPDDPTVGMVPVVVTNAQGSSSAFMVNKQAIAPGLFTYSQEGGAYAVVQAAMTYEPVAPPGLLGTTVTTVRAVPYENVVLWATGLGPTNPAQPTGQVLSGPVPLASTLQITIGGQKVTPQFVGLVYSGVYQINLQIPPLPSGDATITISANGVSGGSALVPIQAPLVPIAGQTEPQLKGCITGPVNYITYAAGNVPFGEPIDVSIAGTDLCPTCSIRTPIYWKFATRMDLALRTNKTIKACYDQNGIIYDVTIQR
jgi:uncharacterized protein (TIGR03437 family)